MTSINLYGSDGLLSPFYADLYNNWNNYRFFTLKGGRFSAKGDTVYTLMLLDLANRQGEARVYVPLKTNIKTGVFKQVLKVAKRIGLVVIPNRSTHMISFPNGSQIFFDGLDATKSMVNTDLTKGADSDRKYGILYCIFDELGAFNEFSRIDDIIDTYLRQKECKFFEISNPPKNKASQMLKRYAQQELNEQYYVLHSTVFDIPKQWVNKGQIDKIKDYKKNDIDRFNHAIMGLSVGVDGLAYDVSNIFAESSAQYNNYVIFTDNGVRDATCFILFGFHANGVHVVDTFYYSGRQHKPLSSFEFGKKMVKFIEYHKLNNDVQIVTDDLEFAYQLRNVNGFKKAKAINNISTKNRANYYKMTRSLIDSNKLKIVNTPDNLIVYNQLSNAEVEVKNINGIEQTVVKKVNNDKVSEDNQLHAIDPIHYFSLVYFKKLGGQID